MVFIQANSEVTNGFNVEMQLRCTTEKYLYKYADLLCIDSCLQGFSFDLERS